MKPSARKRVLWTWLPDKTEFDSILKARSSGLDLAPMSCGEEILREIASRALGEVSWAGVFPVRTPLLDGRVELFPRDARK